MPVPIDGVEPTFCGGTLEDVIEVTPACSVAVVVLCSNAVAEGVAEPGAWVCACTGVGAGEDVGTDSAVTAGACDGFDADTVAGAVVGTFAGAAMVARAGEETTGTGWLIDGPVAGAAIVMTAGEEDTGTGWLLDGPVAGSLLSILMGSFAVPLLGLYDLGAFIDAILAAGAAPVVAGLSLVALVKAWASSRSWVGP